MVLGVKDLWRRVPIPTWTLVGLLGALLVTGGSALHCAMSFPPYGLDETAHVGYALSLEDGQLPTIDTDLPDGHDRMFDRARSRRGLYFSPDVYTANNPPHSYVVAIPFIELSQATGASPLFGFRLSSIVGTVLAVLFAFLLGHELSGGDATAGLATAGLLSAVTSLAMITAWASLDGWALAATTGLTWALARYARARSASMALWVGSWCALAASVRPMSMVFALAAGVIALVLGFTAHGARALPTLALRIGGPTLALAGWFYVLNAVRYGDPTGSRALTDKFDLRAPASFVSALNKAGTGVNPLSFLLRERYAGWLGYDPGPAGPGLAVVVVGVLIGAYLLARRSPRPGPAGTPSPPVPAAWLSVIALCPVPFLLLTQHFSVGGAPHPRYLLPILPVLASAVALLLTRANRWAAVAAVAVAVVVHLVRLPAAGDAHFPGTSLLGPEFNTSLIDEGPQALAFAVAAAGAVLLVAGLVWTAGHEAQPSAATGGSASDEGASATMRLTECGPERVRIRTSVARPAERASPRSATSNPMPHPASSVRARRPMLA
jgi:hypothetical protein